MLIHVGFELVYQFPQDTPLILTVDVHPSRTADIVSMESLATEPSVPISGYHDGFGNWCSRLFAPVGLFRITSGAVVRNSGLADPVVPVAWQQSVETLPEETLVYLLGSRYCETDLLSDFAWNRFGDTPFGWARVQAVCDYVHHHIAFDYQRASPTKTAWQAQQEGAGVCRDYAHLAVTLCRCLNIPARYCTGYLGHMGTPMPHGVGDFAAWLEVYLGGAWHVFDPRNNEPRTGRVLIARGRDAADVAIATTFGPYLLDSFRVWAVEADKLAG
ncbi:MAG: transglutaminase family protein [Acidobacteria bacterium]|nr:transglutaminase family protein [Acidobacteriota bacterium]